MKNKIILTIGCLFLIAWLSFTVYNGIMLFITEVDVACVVAEQTGTVVDVAYRFNVLLILFFSAQIGIMVSIMIFLV
jgi:hypothetical protein